MPPIELLPDTLISQIAAGEVVERPANVLKELVENSLDAGAREITVRLEEGGTELLSVRDDGSGIPSDQLPLALRRHATSKLRRLEDFHQLDTYGFRGEALASIASVSSLRLASRPRSVAQGFEFLVRFGNGAAAAPTAMAPGTLVEVEKLFGELPARKKFLRSPATELAHCIRTLRELALCNPAVRFTMHHGTRRVLQCTASAPLERFRETFGPDWDPVGIAEHGPHGEFLAWLCAESEASERGDLWIAVNGRSVRSRLLQAAVRNAYTRVLGPQREPSGAVHLRISPSRLDVNAHPQKLEVRVLEQDTLFRWVASCVERTLRQARAALPAPVVQAPAIVSARSYLIDEPSTFRLLARAAAGHWILEDSTGLLFLDPALLAERLHFEDFRTTGATAPCSPPQIVRLAQPLVDVFSELHPRLERLGFHAELFGSLDVAVTQRPAMLPEGSLGLVFSALLERLRQTDPASDAQALWSSLSVIECGRGSDSPADRDDSALAARLRSLDGSVERWTCPHGRPIAFRIGRQQLEKHFGNPMVSRDCGDIA